MCALRARKAHLFIQKLHFFFLKLPTFRKKTNASTTKPPKHETLHLPSCRILPPVGKGRHLAAKRKEQRNEALNLFRTKGETIFHRPIHSIHTKKRGVVRVFTFFVLSIRFILLYLHAELLCAFRIDAQRFALSSPSRRRGTDGFALKSNQCSPAVSSKRGTALATK